MSRISSVRVALPANQAANEKENSKEQQMQAISKRAKEIRNEKCRKMMKERCEKYFGDLEQSYEKFAEVQKAEMDRY